MKNGLFDKAVADGMKPDCPKCSSDVEFSDKQKGESGALGYKYKCTNPDCDLSGFAFIPWYHVLYKATLKKILSLGLAILAAVTLTGVAGQQIGIIKIEFPGDDPEPVGITEDKAVKPSSVELQKKIRELTTELKKEKKIIAGKDIRISSLNDSLQSLQEENARFKKNQITQDEKINLGIYYSLPKYFDTGLRNNSEEAIRLLFNTIKDEKVTFGDERWIEIIRALVDVREKIRSEQDFELLIALIQRHYKTKPNPDLALAEVYWAYAYLGNKRKKHSRSLYHFASVAETKNDALTDGQIDDVRKLMNSISTSSSFIEENKERFMLALDNNDMSFIREFKEGWSREIDYPE